MSEQREHMRQVAAQGTIPPSLVKLAGCLRGRGVGVRYSKILAGFASVRDRAEQYRQRSLQLKQLAEAEAYGRLQRQLIELARQYQELADQLDQPQAADD